MATESSLARTGLCVMLSMLFLVGLHSSASPAPEESIPPALQCPGTSWYSSSAFSFHGPYASEAEAEAAIPDAKQAALDAAEDSAENLCPSKCTPPNSSYDCHGSADFDDQGATGDALGRNNEWWVMVQVNIAKTFDCVCDM